MVVGALFVPAVSAEMLEDHGENSAHFTKSTREFYGSTECFIKVNRIQDFPGLKFVYTSVSFNTGAGTVKANPYYESPVTLKVGATTVGHGTAYYNGLFNSAGTATGCQIWVEIDDFTVGSLTGPQTINMIPESGTLFNGISIYFTGDNPTSECPIGFSYSASSRAGFLTGTHMARSHYDWYNTLTSDDNNVYIVRNVGGAFYASSLSVTSTLGTITDTSSYDFQSPYIGVGNWTVTNPYGVVFTGNLRSSADPGTAEDSSTLNLYVRY